MTINLTDAQLAMLSKAAQRTDHCLTPPTGLRGATTSSVEAKLLAAGLVKAIKATAAAPTWRRDKAAGTNVALKLTSAGLKVIAVDEHEGEPDLPSRDVDVREASVQPAARAKAKGAKLKASTERSSSGVSYRQAALAVLQPSDPSEPTSGKGRRDGRDRSPRPGTKLAEVIGLLSRGEGATIAELVTATGWLSHTTRAALTGLRNRGYSIALDRSNRERGSVYQIGTVAGRGDKVQAAEAVAAG